MWRLPGRGATGVLRVPVVALHDHCKLVFEPVEPGIGGRDAAEMGRTQRDELREVAARYAVGADFEDVRGGSGAGGGVPTLPGENKGDFALLAREGPPPKLVRYVVGVGV